jgi:release factor glutamine methyltransferase
MSVSPSPASPPQLPLSTIITRLRTAGCVFAEDEAALLLATAHTSADLAAMVDRRVAGLPLEQVLGWAEFCGLRISLDPGVFVPRRRTEFLVQEAVARFPTATGPTGPTVIVDLCCGSGAVGAALFAALGGAEPRQVELYATDIDPAAVRCARRNLAAAGGRVYAGDLFDPLPAGLRGRVDVLAANVPYVPSSEIELLPAEARVHEPRVALDGGADGLDVLRRVAAAAPGWLAPGGCLLVETSERQAPLAVEVVTQAGLGALVASSEEHYATIVIATR